MRLLPIPGVFQPISDSRMLAAELARAGVGPGTSVLDLCTGSGLLALTAAARGASPVIAVDISRRAVATVRLNALLNGLRVKAVRGDLFAAVPGERFDVIVSNPPHVPSPAAELPHRGPARAWEAGPRGRVFLDRICAEALDHLKPGGVLLLVHSAVCGERETVDALRSRGFDTRVVARHVGGLGPRLRERADWLRDQKLLDEERDEMLVVRAAWA